MVEKKALKITINLLFLSLILLGILIAGNFSLASLLLVYIGMLGISVLAYKSNQYKEKLIYLRLEKLSLTRSILWAGAIAIVFFLATRLVPGFSLGLPLLPQAISDTVRNIIVLGFAPIVESIFFQSVIFAVLFVTFSSKRIAFWGQAVLFSVAHVSAYVTGFYNYPSFAQGLSSITANLGAFISAFVFAVIVMAVTLRKRVNNLAFTIFFHAFINLIIQLTLTIAQVT